MGIVTDFNKSEFELIVSTALDLISKRKLTAINHIHSKEKPLPKNKITIHYLQDYEDQIQNTQNKILQKFPFINSLITPRNTFYRLDPIYTKKPNFIEEYKNAIFLDSQLHDVSIEDVIENPNQKIISNNELDLLIDGLQNKDILIFLNALMQIDKEGPHPWIDFAIIVKDDGSIKTLKDFVRKDYASIRKGNSEFYSVLPNDKSKNYLNDYVAKICKTIKDRKGIKIHCGSLLISKSFINKEFSRYIEVNI